jgi:hypothetical protein
MPECYKECVNLRNFDKRNCSIKNPSMNEKVVDQALLIKTILRIFVVIKKKGINSNVT